MKKFDRVKLITFNGTLINPEPDYPDEDYWKLINTEGQIVGLAEELNFHNKMRCLVKFDISLDDLGLHNHNSVKNSLWILFSDLQLA